MKNAHNILAGLALLFAVLALIWPNERLAAVAVLLLAISVFVPVAS